MKPIPINPFDPKFPVAAIRTLQASRWALWRARLFGRKIVGEDAGYRVVAYEWRGRLFVFDAGSADN